MYGVSIQRNTPQRSVIALLGQSHDGPVDGIEDYNARLAEALARHDIALQVVRMPWKDIGWPRALWWLLKQGVYWQRQQIIIQYTANSWSRIGVPTALLLVLLILRIHGMSVSIRFHDTGPQSGNQLRYRVREAFQGLIMRSLYFFTEKSLLNVPVDTVTWLPKHPRKAAFISVGSNIPPVAPDAFLSKKPSTVPTIALFSITGGRAGDREVADLVYVIRHVLTQIPTVRVRVIGYGSQEAQPSLETALQNIPVELEVYGVIPDTEITHLLSEANVHLFIRGGISSRRTTAIAGIACGLPLVAYSGQHTGFPITEAGVVLVRYGDQHALAEAVLRVLTDVPYQHELRRRSFAAYQSYFTWDIIAQKYCEELDGRIPA